MQLDHYLTTASAVLPFLLAGFFETFIVSFIGGFLGSILGALIGIIRSRKPRVVTVLLGLYIHVSCSALCFLFRHTALRHQGAAMVFLHRRMRCARVLHFELYCRNCSSGHQRRPFRSGRGRNRVRHEPLCSIV